MIALCVFDEEINLLVIIRRKLQSVMEIRGLSGVSALVEIMHIFWKYTRSFNNLRC